MEGQIGATNLVSKAHTNLVAKDKKQRVGINLYACCVPKYYIQTLLKLSQLILPSWVCICKEKKVRVVRSEKTEDILWQFGFIIGTHWLYSHSCFLKSLKLTIVSIAVVVTVIQMLTNPWAIILTQLSTEQSSMMLQGKFERNVFCIPFGIKYNHRIHYMNPVFYTIGSVMI